MHAIAHILFPSEHFASNTLTALVKGDEYHCVFLCILTDQHRQCMADKGACADGDAPANGALAQFDDTQSDIEAGNAALLHDAIFLIPVLAVQATGAAVHPV